MDSSCWRSHLAAATHFLRCSEKNLVQDPVCGVIERGCKTTKLNTKYRSHSRLYESTSRLFYQCTVQSHHHTLQSPPPMLTDLKANLPLLIPGEGTSVYQLSECSHFLNVPNGKGFSSPGGSSENSVEADLAISLTSSLCAMPDFCEGDVTFLSGYTRQVHHVERMARSKDLYTIRVEMVDGSQADDAYPDCSTSLFPRYIYIYIYINMYYTPQKRKCD